MNRVTSRLLLLLLRSHLTSRIRHLHPDLLSTLHNLRTLLSYYSIYSWTHIVRNLGTESTVVHQQHIEILSVVHHKFFKPVGQIVLSFIIRSVSDFGHLLVASESSPHSVINAWMLAWNLLVSCNSRRVCRHRDRIGSGWTWGFASWRCASWGGEWISP